MEDKMKITILSVGKLKENIGSKPLQNMKKIRTLHENRINRSTR